MRKGRFVERGLCLSCKRYYPPASNSCVIVQEDKDYCEFYLQRPEPPKEEPKQKIHKKRKKEEVEDVFEEVEEE